MQMATSLEDNMATERMVNMAMDMYMASYGKKDDWKSIMFPAWEKALERVKDKHLYEAIMTLIQKVHEYPPQLGHLLQEVEYIVKALGGTGLQLKEYKYCDHCLQREGVIEVSCHFLILESKQKKTYNTITRCTCDGAEQKYTQMKSVEELYHTMASDGRITVLAWHNTNSRQPFLTMQQREPHNYQKMLRHHAEQKAAGKPNPFMPVLERIMNGGTHVPNNPMPMPNPRPQENSQPVVDNRTTTHYTEPMDQYNCPF
jgi:hypothetical protein